MRRIQESQYSEGQDLNVRIRNRIRREEEKQRQREMNIWRNRFIQEMAEREKQQALAQSKTGLLITGQQSLLIDNTINYILQNELKWEERHSLLQVLDNISGCPCEIINDHRFYSWLKPLIDKYGQQNDREVLQKIYFILRKYIENDKNYIQNEQYLSNVLPLVSQPEFLYLFQKISCIKDFDSKRLSLRFFQQLIKKGKIYTSQNVSILITCCYNYVRNIEGYNIALHFFFIIFSYLFQICEMSSDQYINVLNIMNMILQNQDDLSAMLSHPRILSYIAQIFPKLTAEHEIVITARFFSRIFYIADTSRQRITKFIPQNQLTKNIIYSLMSTNKKSIQTSCLSALTNIIYYYNSEQIHHSQLIPYLCHIIQDCDRSVRQEIIEFLHRFVINSVSEDDINWVFAHLEKIVKMACFDLQDEHSNTIEEDLKIIHRVFKVLKEGSERFDERQVRMYQMFLKCMKIDEKMWRLVGNESVEVQRLSQDILKFIDQ